MSGFLLTYLASVVMTCQRMYKIFVGTQSKAVKTGKAMMLLAVSWVSTIFLSTAIILIGSAFANFLQPLKGGSEPFGPTLFLHVILAFYIVIPFFQMLYYLLYSPLASAQGNKARDGVVKPPSPDRTEAQKKQLKEFYWKVAILPFVYCWKTLDREFSDQVRLASFAWAIIASAIYWNIAFAPALRLAGVPWACGQLTQSEAEVCRAKMAVRKNDLNLCTTHECLMSVPLFASEPAVCSSLEHYWSSHFANHNKIEAANYTASTSKCWARFPRTEGHRDFCSRAARAESTISMLIAHCHDEQWTKWIFPSTGRNLYLAALAQDSKLGFNITLDDIRILAKLGSDTQLIDKFGNTAAHIDLCYLAQENLIQDYDLNRRNNFGETPLISNARAKKLSCFSNKSIFAAISKRVQDLNARDSNGRTALYHYVNSLDRNTKSSALALMIEQGANLDLPDNEGLSARKLVEIKNIKLVPD